MKKIFSLMVWLVLAASASAQSYNSLWKQVQTDAENDLPQSAIKSIQRIYNKALDEKNEAQMLRSMLMLRTYGYEISPDTAQVYTNRIEALLKTETRPVMQALLHAALAQCYAKRNFSDDNLTANEKRQKADAHFKASITQPEVLANCQTDTYKPLFTLGAASAYFHNDLLQILLDSYINQGNLTPREKTDLLQRMADFYKQRKQYDAAAWLALRAVEAQYGASFHIKGRIEDHAKYKSLIALTQTYGNTQIVVEVYNAITQLYQHYTPTSVAAAHNDSVLYAWAEKGSKRFSEQSGNTLRNFMLQLTQPAATVHDIDNCAYPGSTHTLTYQLRNLQSAELRVVRLFNSQVQLLSYNSSKLKDLAKKQKPLSTLPLTALQNTPAYAWNKGETTFQVPNLPGIYYVEILHKGKHLAGQTLTVTALTALKFATPNGNNRITVVDTRSGKPVIGAKVIAYKLSNNNKYVRQKTYPTNPQGTVFLKTEGRDPYAYALAYNHDESANLFYLSDLAYWENASNQTQTIVQLYTDRAIYRPGQQVQFSGIAFSRQSDNYQVVPHFEATVKLYNVNGKETDALMLRTDSMGTFSGSFTLPTQCLPGQFRLSLNQGSINATTYIRVEAYKRPTFTATTQPLKTAYALGDTLQVTGKAQTYSGIPVSHARVQYQVNRSAWFFWNDEDFEPQSGETTTNAEGSFTLPIWLAPTTHAENSLRYNRYTYTVSYTVTAENGETTQGSTALSVATRPTWLSAQVPTTICRSQHTPLPSFCIQQLNAQGETMAAHGTYTLLCNNKPCAQGTFVSGKPFIVNALANLASGKYKLLYSTPEADESSVEFLLFSDTDTQPADRENPLFFYSNKNQAGDSATILFGSPCNDATLFLDVVAGKNVIESRRIALHNELQSLHFAYKAAYGDGATLYLALLRNGKLHTQQVRVTKPVPNKQLQVKWKSFRSRLTPGQQEQWVLQVTKPNGSPADAQIMACLYDASLDALAPNYWPDYAVTFPRHLSYASCTSNWQTSQSSLFAHLPIHWLTPHALTFSQWDEALFNYTPFPGVIAYGKGKVLRKYAQRSQVVYNMAAPQTALAAKAELYEASSTKALNSPADAGNAPTSAISPRTHFAETAFFRPALRTNAQGEATLTFTLPQSMTQWNFRALAHTPHMDYGRIDTTLVARKEFMVEPALPRFLRKGDRTDLPIKVTNLSGKTICAQLQLTLTDASNQAPPYQAQQTISLAPGTSKVYTFTYNATQAAGMFVCRTIAQGSGYSDGEEHYLPILTTDVEVTRTLPFSLTQKGIYTLRTDTLFHAPHATHRSLAVEISSNPTWYAVTALPALSTQVNCLNAQEWATHLYALNMAQHIANANPEIKQMVDKKEAPQSEAEQLTALQLQRLTDATPWLQQATTQQNRVNALRQLFNEEVSAALLYTAIHHLQALQQPNGSFSWYPGMPGNALTTLEVATLLARSQQVTARATPQTSHMLHAAFQFVQHHIREYVAQLKHNEKEVGHRLLPSEFALRYLYLRTLLNKQPDADANFLLDRAEALRHNLTLYGKALTAITLAKAGRTAPSELALKSLLEHTTTQPEMGRYFDAPRAEWSWNAYRIPTQCATIEALQLFGKHTEANEMCLWLMQAKRTQMWETSRATTDAVYILLTQAATAHAPLVPLGEQTPIDFTLLHHNKRVTSPQPVSSQRVATMGYVYQTFTHAPAVNATAVTLHKHTNGLSWGSVYATYSVPASQVSTQGKGLQLSRRFEVKQGNTWKPLTPNTLLQKGDHVRQIFKLTANRDYDFISLHAARPACFAPAQPLSGYAWNTDLAAYRAVHDSSTDYFIERISKGTHQFSEELFVDRTGTFTTGISSISCVYAPEFCGTTEEKVISIK